MPDHNALAGSEARRLPGLLDGRPFTALLQDDDEQRDAALSRLLSDLARPDVRVVRMGNSMRSRLVLEHLLIQVTGPDGRTSQDDSARQIARTIAERQGREAFVVLLITQAETLHSKTLRLLQAMRPYFAENGAPTLQVVFVGRPMFQTLLEERGMAPLREALGLPRREVVSPATPSPAPVRDLGAPRPLPMAPSVSEPVPLADPAPMPDAADAAPIPAARRSRILVVGLAAFAVMVLAATLGLYAAFHREVTVQAVPSAPQSAGPSPPVAAPPVSLAPGPAAPAPQASVPVPVPTPPAEVVASGRDRSRDAPPAARSSPDPAEPSSRLPSGDGPPPPPPAAAPPDARIIIHVPTGSEGAEAMSVYLLASLGSRLGTVESRRVTGTPDRPSIRYYHPGDEPVARQVAARMAGAGLTWMLQDFSTFQPRPSRGTIEVWLPRP